VTSTGATVNYPRNMVLYHGTHVNIAPSPPAGPNFYASPMWFSPSFENSVAHTLRNSVQAATPHATFYVYSMHVTASPRLLANPPNTKSYTESLEAALGVPLRKEPNNRHEVIMSANSDQIIPKLINPKFNFATKYDGWRSPWDQNEVMLHPNFLKTSAGTSQVYVKQRWVCPTAKFCEYATATLKLAHCATMVEEVNVVDPKSRDLVTYDLRIATGGDKTLQQLVGLYCTSEPIGKLAGFIPKPSTIVQAASAATPPPAK